ncbi:MULTISPECIES: non-homologous end joining protein Ku [Pseudomonas aeruginosa group]|uniref:non-homologous end joining protein Ku n=1 Tax=Pseudomonas aeruginosa group TaxID=136841 RepID=UPI000D14C8EF|nr:MULTISPECIES: Ku protein [Pseudomonas aeruginosa group]AVR68062.1 Ku protein [Pseudomonas paraeruginosa]MBG3907093.1 Ku protein [Pseudomonas aeruginosa]MBG4203037.1 Ku protein [Pseudomonas aeruginosa]MBG4281163.1 Ku protein [Pseudomonas aeruginosa]MBG6893751.1 Ku protein [Pseudomonas aeruginosa]
MARAIWKGAISFGLVHIPVSLSAATSSQGIDFDWLDQRSMDPVGYKRVNKVTGKEIEREHIVKGVEYEKGRYVVLSEEEIRAAHPKSTQTIEIFAFVDSQEIPLQHFDTPYYLSPDRRGGKVYALLRETLESTGKVALANVVLHTRQHLALLRPLEDALVLITLRWPSQVRSLDGLELDESVTAAKLDRRELEMARRLVEDMASHWQPDEYKDSFSDKIMKLVEEKAAKGQLHAVEEEEEVAGKGADIIDLTDLLKRSLRPRAGGGKAKTKDGGKAAATAKGRARSAASRSRRKA